MISTTSNSQYELWYFMVHFNIKPIYYMVCNRGKESSVITHAGQDGECQIVSTKSSQDVSGYVRRSWTLCSTCLRLQLRLTAYTEDHVFRTESLLLPS